MPARGPGPDGPHFERALVEAQTRIRLSTVAADAGYDGEHHHRFTREQLGVRSLIPPLIGRPTKKPPSVYWRRQMKSRLRLTRYRQLWQVETVNSMLKRLLVSALRARRYWSQCREILLRVITQNIMILRRRRFSTEQDILHSGFQSSASADGCNAQPLPSAPGCTSKIVQEPGS